MINQEFLEKMALKKQISLENVFREYAQNLFLSHFYTLKGSENILFKGGTALKLVFESPRYSEDLDFTGLKDNRLYERLLEETMVWLAGSGVVLDFFDLYFIFESANTPTLRRRGMKRIRKDDRTRARKPRASALGEDVILRSPTLRQQLELNEEQRVEILELLLKQDRRMLRNDLQDLLPRSFWPTISDLPSALERELRRG